ncbi:hypothetical protein EI94DRAFT_1699158 [Lactarius quietus]|nr:hypothetical protein EI94DRAFT_1699158 [Lactarius quietus]
MGNSRSISSDLADLNDEERVDPTPIPPMPLETSPPAFPLPKSKSSSGTKSRKRKEHRTHVPSCLARWRMSTARGRDGGRTQSGGVKGVIAPEPGLVEPDDDGDDI